MVLRSRRTLNPIQQLREEMDRLLTGSVGERVFAAGGRSFPTINVWEENDTLYAEAEVPGLKSEHFEIDVVGNELTIKGQRPAAEEGTKFHRRERGVGAFSRTVRLPVDINPDAVQATLRDGVLLITLPKSEAVKPRKIQINAGQ